MINPRLSVCSNCVVQCDLEHLRAVTFDEAVSLVQQHNLISFVETSAATGQGVSAAMQNVLTGT